MICKDSRCLDRRLVVHRSDGGGYEIKPCPECNPSAKENQKKRLTNPK